MNPTIKAPILNQRGIALLYLVIFFTMLGVLVSAGVKMFGSKVTLAKVTDTKAEFEKDVQMITAWGVKNGRLPTFEEYSSPTGVFGTKPKDAWGRSVLFAYYSSLTKVSTGGLCGRTGSSITYNGQDIAFLLLSGGEDMAISSNPNTSGFFNGVLSGLQAEDLYRVVTLAELKAQAGCAGPTAGSLKILNNELPNACKRRLYTATIFADGGVQPYTYSVSGLPVDIVSSKKSIFGTSTTASTTDVTPSYKSYPVEVTVTDYKSNQVKRTYSFRLMTSCI